MKRLQAGEDTPAVPEAAPPAATEVPQSPLRASLKTSIDETSIYDLELLETFVRAIEEDRGSSTPAEDFIGNIVLWHRANPLTPNEVEEHLKEFRENFNDAVWIAKHMTAIHPKLVAAAE